MKELPPSTSSRHITELLSAYLNGTLHPSLISKVEQHLAQCDLCQQELHTWYTIQQATILAVEETLPTPAPSVLDSVLAEVAREERVQQHNSATLHTISSYARHCWLVFKGQIPILHKSIWVASALIMGLACLLLLFNSMKADSAISLLTLFTAVIGTSGAAFLWNAQNDRAYELLLSTPTSPSLVIFSRILLVLGYDIALSLLTSILFALARGEHLAQLVSMWLGPLLLLSSLALMLSLFFGSIVALGSCFTLLIAQSFQTGTNGILLAHPIWWQTNPLLLILAMIFLLIALFYAPRRVHLV